MQGACKGTTEAYSLYAARRACSWQRRRWAFINSLLRSDDATQEIHNPTLVSALHPNLSTQSGDDLRLAGDPFCLFGKFQLDRGQCLFHISLIKPLLKKTDCEDTNRKD